MLSALVKAPGEMLRHGNVYLTLLVVTLVHGVLYWFNQDLLVSFIEGSVGGILWSTDSLLMLRAAGLIVVSLTLTIYSMALVSRSFLSEKYAAKNSLFFSSLAFAIVFFVLMMGTYFLVRGISALNEQGGFISLGANLLSFAIGIIVLVCVIKFSFTPSYMGRGFLPKDALAQSWNSTKGKSIHIILVLAAILVITGLIQSLSTLVTDPIENEAFVYVLYILFSSVGLYYSSSVLALAAPATGMGTLNLHSHKRK